MKLFIPAILASTAFFFSSGASALTSTQVVTNIQVVTKVSDNINHGLASLTPSFDLGNIVVVGKTVITGFGTICTSLSTFVPAMQSTTPITVNSLADDIVDVLLEVSMFVEIHKALLSTVIGKHSIFAQFGFTIPILAALRTLEGLIDTFASAMITLIPHRADAVRRCQATLDISVTQTITTYAQFCLPSPFYPAMQPTCFG
ncbi:hypothetical protein C8R43DRAFT_872873, partial [Mycena crocata]